MATAIVWLTREHLLPTPAVDDKPRPHYRSTPPPPGQPDDLTEVKGIGPVYAERLKQAGITTHRALSESDAATLAETIDVSTQTVAAWIAQAGDKLAE